MSDELRQSSVTAAVREVEVALAAHHTEIVSTSVEEVVIFVLQLASPVSSGRVQPPSPNLLPPATSQSPSSLHLPTPSNQHTSPPP